MSLDAQPADTAPPVRPGRAVGLGDAALAGAPFLWLGAVLAISFLETPLKFQAPGITVPLGLQIGRLVFPALNAAELALCLGVTLLLLRRRRDVGRRFWTLLGGLWLILLVQVIALRPVLDDRAAAVIAGQAVPPAPWHLTYVGLEAVKVLGLLALGTAVVRLVVSTARGGAGLNRHPAHRPHHPINQSVTRGRSPWPT